MTHCTNDHCVSCGAKDRCYRCCQTCNPPLSEKDKQQLVILYHTGKVRRLEVYGLFEMWWQVKKYCSYMSSHRIPPVTLWLETDDRGDILVGEWRNGVEWIEPSEVLK